MGSRPVRSRRRPIRWLGDHGGRWQDPQGDGLPGLDDPGLTGLGLADGLGVDAGSFPHADLGEPSGAVEVQLPVVLQHPLLAGQGQQPLRVRALLDHDPAGAAGQQAGRLAMVPQAFHALGGDDDLDADVP